MVSCAVQPSQVQVPANLYLRQSEPQDHDSLALVVEGEPVRERELAGLPWSPPPLVPLRAYHAKIHSTVLSIAMTVPITTQYMSHTSSFCRSFDLIALYEA